MSYIQNIINEKITIDNFNYVDFSELNNVLVFHNGSEDPPINDIDYLCLLLDKKTVTLKYSKQLFKSDITFSGTTAQWTLPDNYIVLAWAILPILDDNDKLINCKTRSSLNG